MRSTRLAVSVLALVTLAGCGGKAATSDAAKTTPTPSSSSSSASASSSSTPTPTPKVSPASTAKPPTGPRIKGTGYSFAVPTGWRDLTARLRSSHLGVDRAAGSPNPVAGFADNVNVVLTGPSPAGRTALDLAARQIQTALKPSAPHYAVLAQTTIAGSPAAHLAGFRTQGRTRYWLEQFVVVRPAHGYVISFSFSPQEKPAQRSPVIASILAGWRWR